MRLSPPWAVLAPGEPAWLEERVRHALGLDEEEEDVGFHIESPFTIAPGGSHYHLLYSMDPASANEEFIAEQLSLECAEPVYSILDSDYPGGECVMSYRNGIGETLDVYPAELAQSLGCPFPDDGRPPEPPPPPLKEVALVEGLHSGEAALRALEEAEEEEREEDFLESELEKEGFFDDGLLSEDELKAKNERRETRRKELKEKGGVGRRPLPPGCYRLEDTPKGLLIADGTAHLGSAVVSLSERFPLATVYSLMAEPDLRRFRVAVFQRGEGIGELSWPPGEWSTGFYPPVSEIKGERTLERILAALGIPAEWLQPRLDR